MSEFLEYSLLGLLSGGVMALIALSFVLIYKGTGVVNFAVGEVMMLGAFNPMSRTPSSLLNRTRMFAPFGLRFIAHFANPYSRHRACLDTRPVFGCGQLQLGVSRPQLGPWNGRRGPGSRPEQTTDPG